MASKGLVSIIIVNWNGIGWLADCFGSLYTQDYRDFEIVFVDNASSDGSVDWVRKHYPKTKIVVNEKNLGFADANNVGYKVSKGEYVLFLNNDTRVTKTFLTELIAVLGKDKSIGGAQSKLLLMDDPTRLDTVGAFLTNTGFLYHYGLRAKDGSEYDRQIEIYTAKGACMLFKRVVLEATLLDGNIFEPEYFAYFEETDLCHRVWLAGYRIVYAYKSVIYHKMGATSSRMKMLNVQYHSFKNRIHSYLKNLGTYRLMTLLPLHILACEAFAAFMMLTFQFDMAFMVQRAIWWNLKRLKSVISRRIYVQKVMRKVADREIWPYILRNQPYTYYLALLRVTLKFA